MLFCNGSAVLSCTLCAHLRIQPSLWLWLKSPGRQRTVYKSRGSTQQALAKLLVCGGGGYALMRLRRARRLSLWQLDRAQGLFLFAWHFLPASLLLCVNNVTALGFYLNFIARPLCWALLTHAESFVRQPFFSPKSCCLSGLGKVITAGKRPWKYDTIFYHLCHKDEIIFSCELSQELVAPSFYCHDN